MHKWLASFATAVTIIIQFQPNPENRITLVPVYRDKCVTEFIFCEITQKVISNVLMEMSYGAYLGALASVVCQ